MSFIRKYNGLRNMMMVFSIVFLLLIPYYKFEETLGVGTLLLVGAFFLFIYMENYWLKLLLIFMAGVGNALLNTIAGVTFQIFIPQDMRGKVFSLLSTINISLLPLALLFCIVVVRVKSIRRIMNYNLALPIDSVL